MASLDLKSTLIVLAVKEESGNLFENAGILPLYSGIGQVKAGTALMHSLIQKKPSVIMNLGTAGSFHRPVGEIVECSAFVQRHVDSHGRSGPQSKKLFSSGQLSDWPLVTCGTADFIQFQKAESSTDLFDVMDMEAYALAYVAQSFQIPFYSIKCISDNSNDNTVQDWKKNLIQSQQKLFSIYQKLFNK